MLIDISWDINFNSIWSQLASDWKSIVIRLDVDLQQIGSQMVSDWLLIGIQLEVNWMKAFKRHQFGS